MARSTPRASRRRRTPCAQQLTVWLAEAGISVLVVHDRVTADPRDAVLLVSGRGYARFLVVQASAADTGDHDQDDDAAGAR
ncbi:hypothetical protein ABWJ92_37650 [Streptomyces sp. NPDC000609]|uniref:hypothetical protein n=1 Tax=Streptomyces sp. NPDC000609 TaxID=3160957 RepID=UPI003394AB6C